MMVGHFMTSASSLECVHSGGAVECLAEVQGPVTILGRTALSKPMEQNRLSEQNRTGLGLLDFVAVQCSVSRCGVKSVVMSCM